MLVTNPLMETIQDNTYGYNAIGILTNRSRYVEANDSTLSETFHYDELNRRTSRVQQRGDDRALHAQGHVGFY
ncbi:MAG: hypothetical protein Q8L60_00620 [Gammaproteobacteria bacterium]|nr:hypothetical protein [Gammaproteobacteria bacterium]MDP2346635.1 hypothetical protein [Gammaproteobacteria bacterium]